MVSYLTYLHQKLTATLIRLILRLLSGPTRKEIAQTPHLYPSVTKTAVSIPSRDARRSIKAHLYYSPPTTISSASTSIPEAPKPILINWHGSGFVFTSMFGSDAYFCAKVAAETGIYVLDADYRKAPENRWPAAVHDVEDVLNWVGTQSSRFDSSRVAVSGFSAGGNLALIAAGRDAREEGVRLRAVVGVYPAVDLSIPSKDKVVPNPIKEPPAGTFEFFNACYLSDVAVRTDPLVSPAYAPVENFPQTMVLITAEGDSLAPEVDAFAKKVSDGEREVVHKNFAGMWHGFDKGAVEGTAEWKAREEAYGMVVEALKGALCK